MSSDMKAALEELNQKVLGKPGVSGTAVGESRGAACLVVYLNDARARASVPKRVRGIPVRVEVSGPFEPR